MSKKHWDHRWLTGLAILSMALGACNLSPEAKEAKYIEKGKSLVEKKDYARAMIEFKNASKVKPKDAEPYFQVGLAYLNGGNPVSAVPAFRKALSLNPKHAGAQLKLDELLASTRNKDLVEQARTSLESIVAGSPGNTEASDALAVADLRLGKTDEGIKQLEETLARVPSHLSASVNLAMVKLRQKDRAGAEEILKKAVASAPQSPEAALVLGEFYMSIDYPAQGEPEIQRAVQLDPKNGQALMALARIQVHGNRKKEAEQTYRRAATLSDARYKPVYAMYLYSIGERDAAVKEFEQLAKNDPDDRKARTRLLALYLELGKTAEAQAWLAEALKKHPKDTDALLQRSTIYLQSGKIAEAERDLNQVLHYQGTSAEAHYGLASVYRAQGLARNERQEFNEALRLQPAMLAARLALARELLAGNEAKAALELINNTPVAQRQIAGVIEQRNWALLGTNATKELEVELKRVLQVRRTPEFVLQEAILKMVQGDYAGARADAEEVLKSRGGDLRAVRVVVDSYVAQKQPEKAGERIRELADAQPKSAPLHVVLAQWYEQTGEPVEARKALEEAKTADPKLLDADIGLASLDQREKHFDAAKKRLAGVMTVSPKNVAALLSLASVNEESGDHDGAIANYRAILEIDKSNIFALNNLAFSLAVSHPDEALKLAQQAAELKPDSPMIQDTLGWVYFHKGLYDSALGYLKAGYSKQPTARRQYHLAMCYLKSGDQDQGMKNLRAALQQDPNLGKEQ